MTTNQLDHSQDDDASLENDFADPIDSPEIFSWHGQPMAEDDQTDGLDTTKPEQQPGLERTRGLSFFKVLLNFSKSLIGVGFLALPMAFCNAGLYPGLVLLVISAVLNCYCMMQLVEGAQYHYKRRNVPYLSYGNLAKQACKSSFPWIRPHRHIAKKVVNASILALEFGLCSTYYVFIAKSLQEIFCWQPDIRIWLALIYVPMVLLTFIRSMRLLSYFSLAGNVLMLLSSLYIIYALIDHLLSEGRVDTPADPFGSSVLRLFVAFGTIIFTFEAQTLVLPLEKELKKPRQMLGLSGILSCGIFIATIVYASVGTLGYLTYGSSVRGSITQNLDEKNLATLLVKVALISSICSGFLLQMYVIVEVLWSRVARMLIAGETFKTTNAEKDQQKRCWQLPSNFKFACELCFRALMVTVCFAVACAVPTLEDIIPLVGCTFGTLLAFVFPALIDLFTFVPLLLNEGCRQRAILRLCTNILLVCVGLFGMGAGLMGSITDLIEGGAQNNENMCANTTSTHMH